MKKLWQPVELASKLWESVELAQKFWEPVELAQKLWEPVELALTTFLESRRDGISRSNSHHVWRDSDDSKTTKDSEYRKIELPRVRTAGKDNGCCAITGLAGITFGMLRCNITMLQHEVAGVTLIMWRRNITTYVTTWSRSKLLNVIFCSQINLMWRCNWK